MVGSSVFYKPDPPEMGLPGDETDDNKTDPVQSLAAELAESQQERENAENSERHLSSLVWIISSASGIYGHYEFDING